MYLDFELLNKGEGISPSRALSRQGWWCVVLTEESPMLKSAKFKDKFWVAKICSHAIGLNLIWWNQGKIQGERSGGGGWRWKIIFGGGMRVGGEFNGFGLGNNIWRRLEPASQCWVNPKSNNGRVRREGGGRNVDCIVCLRLWNDDQRLRTRSL